MLGRKCFTFVIIIILCFGFSNLINYGHLDPNTKVTAEIITVNDDGDGANFTTIQAAINNAQPGDTIYVWAGVYNERIIVNKTVTIIGNGTGNTTINGTGFGDAVRIAENFVNISGFTIQNSGSNTYDGGIRLHRVINCTVSNNNCSNNRNGIYISMGSGHTITNNTCTNNFRGIFAYQSNSNIIKNNTCDSNQDDGIHVYYSDLNTIAKNNCSNNSRSIMIYRNSDNNVIENNICNSSSSDDISIVSNSRFNKIANNTCNGITIDTSGSNMVFNNTIGPTGVTITGDQVQHWNQTFDLNNTMDSKTIIYWYNVNNSIVPGNTGQIILFNCENITVEDLDFSNITTAIILGFSNNNKIRNNTATNVSDFIYLSNSDNNTIINNTYRSGNTGDIRLVENSNSNMLTNNTCGSMILESSGNNTVMNNSMISSGVSIQGNKLEHWVHNFDLNNTVKNEIVYYMHDVKNTVLPLGGGQVILINCQNITVQNQNFSDKGAGIILGFSNNNKIINNTCLNNSEPINLWNSDNNIIKDNKCINTSRDGLVLSDSDSNQIINNTINSNVQNGIKLISCDYTILYKNTCNWNQRDGIYLNPSNSNTIKNNICNSNKLNGLSLSNSDSNTISDHNRFNSNTNHGIYLSSSETNAIKDTECKFNIGDGININNADFNSVMESTCTQNDGNGINNHLSEYSTMIDNNCSANDQSGIVIMGEYVGYSHVPHGDHNTIEKNICDYNNQTGINMTDSNNNTVANNSCSLNVISGIRNIGYTLVSNWLGIENTFEYNICNSNQQDGFYFHNGTFCIVRHNTMDSNTRYGFYGYYSMENTILNNQITNNNGGLHLNYSEYYLIQNNLFSKNSDFGIYLRDSDANIIKDNNCSDNINGIQVYLNSKSNNILGNLISGNTNVGVNISLNCNNNRVYHNNIMNNNIQAEDNNNASYINYWYNYYEEGNHWSDYTGSDNGADGRIVGDGIGDTKIPHLGIDKYPFIRYSGWLYPGTPKLEDLVESGEIDSDGTYTLYWNETRNTLGFILEEAANELFEPLYETFITSGVSYNIISNPNGIYHYRVKAYNNDFESAWSNYVNITVNYVPDVPQDLEVDVYPEGNCLNLTWMPVYGDTVTYELFYKIGTSTDWELLAAIEYPTNVFDHTGLINGVTYYYRVRAIDVLNQTSGFSKVVSGIPDDSVPPSPPTGLSVEEITANSISLVWNKNFELDIKGYNVYRNTSSNPSDWGEPVNGNNYIRDGAYIDEHLKGSTTYYYVISAYDKIPNESEFSQILSVTTLVGDVGPAIYKPLKDLQITEDTPDNSSINLNNWFKDPNDDELIFECKGQNHIQVEISQETGKVLLIPEKNWNGKETLIFYASDLNHTIYDDLVVTVAAVNDAPEHAEIIIPTEGYNINDSTPIYFEGRCDDADLSYGDKLTFIWSSNISGRLGTGRTLTNKILSAGYHKITMEVVDTGGKSTKAYVNITITKTPTEGPKPEPKDDDDETKDEEKNTSLFNMITIISVTILIILVIYFLFIFRKNIFGPPKEGKDPFEPPKKDKEEELEDEEDEEE